MDENDLNKTYITKQGIGVLFVLREYFEKYVVGTTFYSDGRVVGIDVNLPISEFKERFRVAEQQETSGLRLKLKAIEKQ